MCKGGVGTYLVGNFWLGGGVLVGGGIFSWEGEFFVGRGCF